MQDPIRRAFIALDRFLAECGEYQYDAIAAWARLQEAVEASQAARSVAAIDVPHGRFVDADYALLHSATVELLLWAHRNCTQGYGDTPESCSARTQLLIRRYEQSWTWPIPGPDRKGESC